MSWRSPSPAAFAKLGGMLPATIAKSRALETGLSHKMKSPGFAHAKPGLFVTHKAAG
jgi:hypothetical protein